MRRQNFKSLHGSNLQRHVVLEAVEPRLLFSQFTFLVTNTNDSGNGSFRQAIQQANALPAADSALIQFKIAGSGVHTLEPLSGYDFITADVAIVGQTDSAGNPLIQINGSKAGAFADGLFLDRNTPGNTQASEISGLIINQFGASGIDVHNGSAVIFGCRIGTNAAGTAAAPNGQEGILVEGQGNFIGEPGSGPAFQLLVSGNDGNGLTIPSSGNRVQNCLIGTDVTGTKAIPNGGWGIEATGVNNQLGRPGSTAGLVVSGNVAGGIHLMSDDSSADPSTAIQNSKIGTDITGTKSIQNKNNGIYLDESYDAVVGGSAGADGNIISGNYYAGVVSSNSTGCLIENNKIGTNGAGSAAIGNLEAGIFIDSVSNTVESNLISGNGFDGIVVEEDAFIATQTYIKNNYIGTDATGKKAIPNKGDGILLSNTPTNTVLSNVIAFNAVQGEDGFGVDVLGNTSTGNTIEQNSIFSNGRLGINLGDNGGVVVLNDPEDKDNGANGLQNFPVLSSGVPTSGKLVVKGTINSKPNSKYRIEFFSSPAADPSGYGEGETFLGFENVTTNSSGNATITLTLPAVAAGQYITATATDGSGNTSEFSKAIKVS